jgi:hypothetical protein
MPYVITDDDIAIIQLARESLLDLEADFVQGNIPNLEARKQARWAIRDLGELLRGLGSDE